MAENGRLPVGPEFVAITLGRMWKRDAWRAIPARMPGVSRSNDDLAIQDIERGK
jgi:hypothetical protein